MAGALVGWFVFNVWMVLREASKIPKKDWKQWQEQYQEEEKGWRRYERCLGSAEGCQWPGNCKPGDCRRVEGREDGRVC
jgi:hypothetical protein